MLVFLSFLHTYILLNIKLKIEDSLVQHGQMIPSKEAVPLIYCCPILFKTHFCRYQTCYVYQTKGHHSVLNTSYVIYDTKKLSPKILKVNLAPTKSIINNNESISKCKKKKYYLSFLIKGGRVVVESKSPLDSK